VNDLLYRYRWHWRAQGEGGAPPSSASAPPPKKKQASPQESVLLILEPFLFCLIWYQHYIGRIFKKSCCPLGSFIKISQLKNHGTGTVPTLLKIFSLKFSINAVATLLLYSHTSSMEVESSLCHRWASLAQKLTALKALKVNR